MLGFAHVQLNIFGFSVLTDDHTGVYFGAWSDEQSSSVLGREQAVGNGFTRLIGDQRALFAVLKVTFIWGITVIDGVQHTGSFGDGQELVAESD